MIYKKWDDPVNIEACVTRYINGETLKQIADDYQTSGAQIGIVLRRQGVTIRPKNVIRKHHDATYFSEIDTEEKAYWVGFLAADGCVSPWRKKWTVALGLAECDRPHIERFLTALESDHTVIYNRATKSFAVAIYCEQLALDLIRLGLTPRKTETFNPPRLQPSLMRHFWRGMIDGDGHVSLRVRKGKVGRTPVFELYGNKAVCDAFVGFVNSNTPYPAKPRHKKGMLYCVSLSPNAARCVAKLLYRGSTVFLPRKHTKAIEIADQKLRKFTRKQ